MKQEHVERLIQGKSSGINIGSRAVPHHLFVYEKTAYKLALKHKYLVINTKSRINLQNVWQKVCIANNWPNIVVIQQFGKNIATVYVNNAIQTELPLQQAKEYAATYFTTCTNE